MVNDIANDCVGPMPNPPHPDEPVRKSMDGVGWNVTGPPPNGARAHRAHGLAAQRG